MLPEENAHLGLVIISIFVVVALILLIQICVAAYCVSKRLQRKRAPNWLEVIGGYDKEQRK